MEKINNINWYLGISLDKFNSKNPKDTIDHVSFFDKHNQFVYAHFQTSYEDKELFQFSKYQELDFKTWVSQTNITIPLSNQKFNQIKGINTTNHVSLKKFLKAFGFDEYII